MKRTYPIKGNHEQVRQVISTLPTYGVTFPRPDVVSVDLADGDEPTAIQIRNWLQRKGLLRGV